MQKSFIAQAGQSIMDLALYAYGDPQEVIKLASENPGIDINAYDYSGKKIFYTPTANSIKSRLTLGNTIPATASGSNANYILQETGFAFELEDGAGKIELE